MKERAFKNTCIAIIDSRTHENKKEFLHSKPNFTSRIHAKKNCQFTFSRSNNGPIQLHEKAIGGATIGHLSEYFTYGSPKQWQFRCSKSANVQQQSIYSCNPKVLTSTRGKVIAKNVPVLLGKQLTIAEIADAKLILGNAFRSKPCLQLETKWFQWGQCELSK